MQASKTISPRVGKTAKCRKNPTRDGADTKGFWVAVKVERGFIREAVVFESLDKAKRTERKWRARLNPDYDEAAVVKSRFLPCRASKLRHSR